ALVNVTTPEFEPIVGAIAEPRAGLSVVRSPGALHVELARVGGGGYRGARAARARGGGDGYPEALLGGIACVRQSFVDAQYQQMVEQRYQKNSAGVARPAVGPELTELQSALAGPLARER